MASSKVKSPIRLAHVVLRTPDIKRLVNFYTDFLGAHVVFENDFIAFITYDDEHHRIAVLQLPGVGPKVPNTAGLEHIAFTYETLDDMALTYAQRKERGMLPVRCLNHGPTTSMYYADPDGNQIEIQVDNFETADGATAFMMDKYYRENPIGTEFEPEDLIARVKSGESHASIKRRPDVDEATWKGYE